MEIMRLDGEIQDAYKKCREREDRKDSLIEDLKGTVTKLEIELKNLRECHEILKRDRERRSEER